MRAAVYKGKQQLEVEEVPTPTPGPGQVLLKIKYCAICGTDVHAFLYDIPSPGTIMGHEYCGTMPAKLFRSSIVKSVPATASVR